MSVVRNDDDNDKNSWLATLACSPGMGVGVLECWGVCTKGFKHINHLNPAHMQTFRHQANDRVKYTHHWNGICQDLVNHRVKFRRLLPKLSGRAHLWEGWWLRER